MTYKVFGGMLNLALLHHGLKAAESLHSVLWMVEHTSSSICQFSQQYQITLPDDRGTKAA